MKITSFLSAVAFLAGGAFAQTGVLSNMTLAADDDTYRNRNYADVWGYVDPQGREYAIVTTRTPGGMSIVEITDPNNPVERAFVNSPGGTWHDVKTYRNYAYKVGDQGTAGVQIVDLSGLPNSVRELSAYNPGTRSHNLWLDSTANPPHLYIQGGGGIIIASLENPERPQELGRINVECHDMHAQHHIRENRLYVSTGRTNSWDTYNISNPASPQRLARVTFSSSSYSHNLWLSEDGQYMFTTQETAGQTVKAWDLTSERTPQLASEYIAPVGGGRIIAHNVHVFGKYLYVPHYTAGLRIVDISQRPLPDPMPEVGYHQPSTATGAFDGTWGSYQWFPSGVVIHADNLRGLQVLIPNDDIIQPNVPVSIAGRSYTVKPFQISAASSQMKIQLPKTGEYTLSIFDMAGKEVFNANGNGSGVQLLDLDMSRGNYVARLKQAAAVETAKLNVR